MRALNGDGGGLAQNLSDALAQYGLIARGGFAFAGGQEAPAGPDGSPARALVLVGHGGAPHWTKFCDWRAARPHLADPLDSWSEEAVGSVAGAVAARAVFPSQKPYLPFQQWAMRAEGLKPSPLGILMHPEYGLWHAYRAALLFEESALAELHALIQPPAEAIHLCDLCVGKPCLKSCPVDAYAADGFAYAACRAHVGNAGGSVCREGGCLDRNACPHGAEYRYPAEMQAFHMAAFMRGA